MAQDDGKANAALQLMRDDFLHYAPRALKIKQKSGAITPFVLNSAQVYLHHRIERQRQRTGKVRILAQAQQLIRLDYEKNPHDGLERMCAAINERMPYIDAIIISDYNKGVITERLMTHVKEAARKRHTPIIVDPKPPHGNLYRDVSLVTPNLKEAEQLSSIAYTDDASVQRMGRAIARRLHTDVIITRGEHGMDVFERGKPSVNIPTTASQVYDVSGAGDTVIATLGVNISKGLSLRLSAVLANYAAGIVVEKLGTATVTPYELNQRVQQTNEKSAEKNDERKT